MRNGLLIQRARKTESTIINLDDKNGPGMHWVLYKKVDNNVVYFYSFGNLQPSFELVNYFGDNTLILYNHENYQDYDIFQCVHLCLKFLCEQLIVTERYILYK